MKIETNYLDINAKKCVTIGQRIIELFEENFKTFSRKCLANGNTACMIHRKKFLYFMIQNITMIKGLLDTLTTVQGNFVKMIYLIIYLNWSNRHFQLADAPQAEHCSKTQCAI